VGKIEERINVNPVTSSDITMRNPALEIGRQ
jgi:hypothetical protein